MSASQIGGLSNDQLGSLTTDQLSKMSATQLTKLTATQISHIGNVDTGSSINDLTTDVLVSLTSSQIKGINTISMVHSLDAEHVSAVITKLSPVQIAELSDGTDPSDAAFGRDTTGGQLGQLSSIDLSSMSAKQLRSIPAANIAALDATQLGATTTVVQQFTTAQIAKLTGSDDSNQVGNISTESMSQLSALQLKALGANSAALSPDQIGAIDTHRTPLGPPPITGLDVAHMTVTGSYDALTDYQIAGLSSNQISSLNESLSNELSSTGLEKLLKNQAQAFIGNSSAFQALDASKQAIIHKQAGV